MNKSEVNPIDNEPDDFAEAATKAMLAAAIEAERENARFGLPMIVSKNGKVVEVPTRPEFQPRPLKNWLSGEAAKDDTTSET